jgi:hypothetical protein
MCSRTSFPRPLSSLPLLSTCQWSLKTRWLLHPTTSSNSLEYYSCYPKNSSTGLVDNCYNAHGPDYHIIDKNHRDYELQKEQAFNQAKYLAKTHTKELNPQGSWRCTGTRIPKTKK